MTLTLDLSIIKIYCHQRPLIQLIKINLQKHEKVDTHFQTGPEPNLVEGTVFRVFFPPNVWTSWITVYSTTFSPDMFWKCVSTLTTSNGDSQLLNWLQILRRVLPLPDIRRMTYFQSSRFVIFYFHLAVLIPSTLQLRFGFLGLRAFQKKCFKYNMKSKGEYYL